MHLHPLLAPSILLLVGSVLGWEINIASPKNGTVVKRGQELVVEIERPWMRGGQLEVGMFIGLQWCHTPDEDRQIGPWTCTGRDETYYDVLWSGKFEPVDPTLGGERREEMLPRPAYQTFNVTIPDDGRTLPGLSQLRVVRMALNTYRLYQLD
ncbi:hypothetical protein MKEN_00303900 [Mycena kentingensis (nom. inval.)]|nr:hypothetical protein MKEN_00303900 [Mycena kentingensis (nom. inval.)]